MSDWKQVGENLVRYRDETIYLRAKVGGKIVRRSLETSELRIAKLRRDEKLGNLRKAAEVPKLGIKTLGQAIDQLEFEMLQPHLKDNTRETYAYRVKSLRKTVVETSPVANWSQADAKEWWKSITKKYGPLNANAMLDMIRQTMGIVIEQGVRTSDPTAKLKKMPYKSKIRNLPSRKQIDQILAQVRGTGSKHAADVIAFLAYTGCRPGEARAVRWEHVGEEWLTITGGLAGTKNYSERQIPISPALRKLLDRLHHDGAAGPILLIKSPRHALTSATKALKLPHMRVYDLRHWFTSWCIELGIEIPTISRWLGHKDGGALLMRTYGHLRDAHSLKQARKLK